MERMDPLVNRFAQILNVLHHVDGSIRQALRDLPVRKDPN